MMRNSDLSCRATLPHELTSYAAGEQMNSSIKLNAETSIINQHKHVLKHANIVADQGSAEATSVGASVQVPLSLIGEVQR